MNAADQLRDLADVVETVQSGPAAVCDADLGERDDGQVVAQLDVEVPLPLGEHLPEQPTDDTGETEESMPVAELADVASGLGETITSRLEEAGYETVADIEAASRDELEDVPRVGPKTVDELIVAVDELNEDTPPTENPEPPAWTPDSNTGGIIVPTRSGQDGGQKP